MSVILFPEELKRRIATYFSQNFDITWQNERNVLNTRVYIFLLKPKENISETFGFDKEIPLFVSGYTTLQPRTMQAIEQICTEHPLAGRIDTSTAFLFSQDPNLKDWVSRYKSENPENRLIVTFDKINLENSLRDPWNLINSIKSVLFISNLFDYKLPLKSDRYFYGRENIVATIFDNARKNQNSGLFGLRKTGKTSVLFKAQRAMAKSGQIYTIFIDCKVRQIRNLTCDDLAKKIISKIEILFPVKSRKKIDNFDDIFECLGDRIRTIPANKKVCIFFDEIEYISPISPTNVHWKSDFIDLWQCLWTIQSTCDKISYVVCGVNSSVCEIDRFPSPSVPERTIQNPMFSIFNTYYLTGLDYTNLKNMVNLFGSRMGMFFDNLSINYLFDQYGGHPLLIRLACSFHHEYFTAENRNRPISINSEYLTQMKEERDAELISYCGHVVSEISELYPDEYGMLKLLASGQIADFHEKSKNYQAIKHIKDYGLIEATETAFPKFKIPVIKRYLEHTADIGAYLSTIEVFKNETSRFGWLKRRLLSISDDIILLDQEMRDYNNFSFYKSTSAFQAHHFMGIDLVSTKENAVSFLVNTHKYLVEPIDKFLRDGGVAKNISFKQNVPQLREALMRLKNYRNMLCHVDISQETETGYKYFLQTDFSGEDPESVPDGWFRMQKIILDNIHVAIQIEIAKI